MTARTRRSPWPTTPNTAWPARCGPPTSSAARRWPRGSGPGRSRSTHRAPSTRTGPSAGSRTPGSAGRAAPRRWPTTPRPRPSCCRRAAVRGADMSVLVLGSSGLVGRRLVGRLAATGNTVVACDIAPPTTPPVDGVSYVSADMSRIDRILALLQEHDVSGIALLSYIMGPLMSPQHSDILQACQVNVVGVTNVLEAARLSGTPRVVFLSTVG